MATFTYTPWVNGEVITADKLNNYNCKLVLTQEDIENGFTITIPAELSAEDFLAMMVKSDDNISKVISVASVYDGWLVLSADFDIYCNPTTGTLQSTSPRQRR